MKRGTLAFFGAPGSASGSAADVRPERPVAPAVPDRLPPAGCGSWGFPVPESAFSGRLDRYNGDLGSRGQGESPDPIAS